MHKEIKSILCSVVREETIDCFEETISCFSEAATGLNFKNREESKCNCTYITHIDEDFSMD